ncbi:DUF2514 domain-containing protein [Variovorax sp.]|uniref:DUF2514 domain-containing protein n=1 Tax=Variovorax sp. TaxID=1871043 RepID=UPI003BA8FFCD
MNWLRLAVAAVVLAAATAGVLMVRANWIAEGGATVQQRWDAQVSADRAAAAENALELQRIARRDESRKQEQNERIARELQDRNARLSVRAGALDARNRELLGAIAALDADVAAVPGTAADAGAPAGPDGPAITAREVLGRCVVRYGAVAQDAARSASQLIGLQQYVATVCHPARTSE